jgi:CheY-like chemotaxis protein
MSKYSVDTPIVESEPISRHQLPSDFEKKRKAVIHPANPYGVIERTSEGNFDVYLIKMGLLRKDGLTLTRELCATSNVGIILVTVKNNQITQIRSLTFLHKQTNDFFNIYGSEGAAFTNFLEVRSFEKTARLVYDIADVVRHIERRRIDADLTKGRAITPSPRRKPLEIYHIQRLSLLNLHFFQP